MTTPSVYTNGFYFYLTESSPAVCKLRSLYPLFKTSTTFQKIILPVLLLSFTFFRLALFLLHRFIENLESSVRRPPFCSISPFYPFYIHPFFFISRFNFSIIFPRFSRNFWSYSVFLSQLSSDRDYYGN